jgi:hypothetical protein
MQNRQINLSYLRAFRIRPQEFLYFFFDIKLEETMEKLKTCRVFSYLGPELSIFVKRFGIYLLIRTLKNKASITFNGSFPFYFPTKCVAKSKDAISSPSIQNSTHSVESFSR